MICAKVGDGGGCRVVVGDGNVGVIEGDGGRRRGEDMINEGVGGRSCDKMKLACHDGVSYGVDPPHGLGVSAEMVMRSTWALMPCGVEVSGCKDEVVRLRGCMRKLLIKKALDVGEWTVG